MTTEDDMLRIVLNAIRDMGRDTGSITLETALEDCGITSLEAIDLAFKLEEELNITINMEDFRVRTVGDAVSFLLTRLPAAPAASAA